MEDQTWLNFIYTVQDHKSQFASRGFTVQYNYYINTYDC